MGFGIALFGYAFLILNELGGALIGGIMLAYGFFLASRLEAGFLRASVSALFMVPRGIVLFCSAFGLFDLMAMPTLNTVTFLLHLAAWFMMSYFWLSSVAKIAKDCDAYKLERQARNRLVMTTAFIFLSMAAGVMNIGGMLGQYAAVISAVQYVLQYAVIIINTLFLHTCFVLITSERQYEKDKQELAKEHAKALEKKHNENREAAKRIEKFKK